MEYQLQLRKFITSQYLYTGLRITAGVIIPAAVLYQLGLLVPMIGIPIGALFVSLTDNPGPIAHRRNGMLISIALLAIVVLITGYSRVSSFMIGIEIILFGMVFSLISVYGNRANTIGLIVLTAFILNIDATQGRQPLLQQTLHITIGGIWYMLLSLTLYTLRPYRPIQQLLGECFMETASYLRTRASFYSKERDNEAIFRQLMIHQVHIHNHQNELRDMLFTTRKVLSESTRKGRVLMMSFLDSIDLMERIMTSQQDYQLLHKEFDGTGILDELKDHIIVLSNELHHIGMAIQGNYAYRSSQELDNRYQQSFDAFTELRSKYLNADTIEGFISLRHILHSLEDITVRIKRLQAYTTYDKKISKQYRSPVDVEQFITHQEINPRLLLSNLSLKSSAFRHAVKITIALLAGYIVSLLLPVGHGYWILLTISVIMKPAYSITRKRNGERLIGTFIGAAFGFLLLLVTTNHTVIFISMLALMIIAYSFLRLNYTVSSAGITVSVLLMFYFLDPSHLNTLLVDRIIDTFIGSVLAYIVSSFVLPVWEHEQIDEFIKTAIENNHKYFIQVAGNFTGNPPDITAYKVARKDAFVALANLSDMFQRMLSEPKSQQPNLPQYHQFVTASHMLTSYIASLSYYAQRFGNRYVQEDFSPMVKEIDRRFALVADISNNKEVELPAETARLPIHKKVEQLLEQRKKDLNQGIESDAQSVRKTLSDLKTITDQFELIFANLTDQAKVLLRARKPVKATVPVQPQDN